MYDDSSSSSPLRRAPTHDEFDDDDLEEGQFVPDEEAHPRRGRLSLRDVLALGPGDALSLPSPTPSSSCESDRTISDDDDNRVVVALDGAKTLGWTGGKPPAAALPLTLSAESGTTHSNVSADSNSAQAVVVHQPSPAPPISLMHLAQVATQAAAAAPPPAQLPRIFVSQRAGEHRPPREYTCNECGKSYTSNQALGGHVAGHKNRQRNAEAAAAGMMEPGQDGALRRRRREDAPHVCDKCGKVFARGVSLGGHMRVHYTGPPILLSRKNKTCLGLAVQGVAASPPSRKKKKTCLGLAVQDGAALPPSRKKKKKTCLGLAVQDGAALPPSRKKKKKTSIGLAVQEVAASPSSGLSLAPSIKMKETPAPAKTMRLFGFDISPQEAPSEQQCSGTTVPSAGDQL